LSDRTLPAVAEAAARRRTFAIISHPDAGKTTLTEKLLLMGGAIHLAGEVKAKGERRRARSDWMKIEQQRGISVTTSVMTFEYGGCTFNLLDTPGHEDFSEDTYRTLTAVDSAVMVIDAAKGIEPQTRKLFEVCRLRDVPIMTFVNKMDREAKDPIELLDELADKLQLDIAPMNWPVGMGQNFRGVFDFASRKVVLLTDGDGPTSEEAVDRRSNSLALRVSEAQLDELDQTLELVEGALPAFDQDSYREGHLSPAFFGSALKNFGVRAMLDGLASHAPSPGRSPRKGARSSRGGVGHRLRVQGPGEHGPEAPRPGGVRAPLLRPLPPRHEAHHGPPRQAARGVRTRSCSSPGARAGGGGVARRHHRPAQPRPAPRRRRLERGRAVRFTGIPNFAPEILMRVRLGDPMRAKHLRKALEDMAEEGVTQVFRPYIGADWIVGVVGQLQLDVLKTRLDEEYGLPIGFEPAPYITARWCSAEERRELDSFVETKRSALAQDRDGNPVYLARNGWDLNRVQEDFPRVRFTATRERHT
jgi:peptide chain release factor 3